MDESRLEDFVALMADLETMRYWAPIGPFSCNVAERSFAASFARIQELGLGRRWIVSKENGAGPATMVDAMTRLDLSMLDL